MPGTGTRLMVPVLGRDLVRWGALGWCVLVGALSLVALTVAGWPPAMGGALIAVGPILFLAVLQQRSAMRIRALSRDARSKSGGRPPNGPTAHPEKPSRDAGRR
jgi:hypothetical protein